MTLIAKWVLVAGVFSRMAFGQADQPPAFDLADVHKSPMSSIRTWGPPYLGFMRVGAKDSWRRSPQQSWLHPAQHPRVL